MNSKRRTPLILLLVVANSLALFAAGFLFSAPRAVAPVGMLVGVMAFYSIYAILKEVTFRSDITMFAVLLVSSLIASALLWGGCQFWSKPVCLPNPLEGQVLGNFAYPLIPVIPFWVLVRLPMLFRKQNRPMQGKKKKFI